MASSKSLISTALAGLALCVASSAQSGNEPVQALQAQKFEGGITRVRAERVVDENGVLKWDYTVLGKQQASQTGNAPQQATPGQRKVLVNCFQNTVTNGFFSVGTNGTEWMDWALKSAGKTDIVGGYAFAYASNARGLSEPGGTGATIGVSFYSGTTGFCARGTRANDVTIFSSLPGATGTQASPGFAVTATLDNNDVFCLPDGKIGWAYFFQEPPMGTNQNATGPLLSGPVYTGSTSNTCWNDVFDLWSSPDPVASCAGVFFFGGCNPPTTFFVPPPCAGFWIQIFEETATLPAISSFNNVVGLPNPVRYVTVTAATIGNPWVTNIFTDSLNPAGPEVAGVIRFCVPGTIIAGVPLALLVNGSRLVVLGPGSNIIVSNPGNPKVSSIGIPKDLSFIGSTFNTQAFGVILAPVRLQALNGLSATVGAI